MGAPSEGNQHERRRCRDQHDAQYRGKKLAAHRPSSFRKRRNSSTTSVSTADPVEAADGARRHVRSRSESSSAPNSTPTIGPSQTPSEMPRLGGSARMLSP